MTEQLFNNPRFLWCGDCVNQRLVLRDKHTDVTYNFPISSTKGDQTSFMTKVMEMYPDLYSIISKHGDQIVAN